MKQLVRISILVSSMVLLYSSPAPCVEEEVLKVLETIKARVAAGVSPEALTELLDEAKIQIDALEHDERQNDCFRHAVRRCYYWYDSARRTRDTMIENQKQRDACDEEAIFGDEHMKAAYANMVVNYEKLIRHAYETLPAKWAYGNSALEMAQGCLKGQE